jgi:hypothetical protein
MPFIDKEKEDRMLEDGQVSKLERQHFEEMMDGKNFKNKCLAFKVPERKKPHEKLRSQLPNEFEPVVQPQPIKANKRPLKEDFIQPAPLQEQPEPTKRNIKKG